MSSTIDAVAEPIANATNAALATPEWWQKGIRAPFWNGEAFASLIHGNTDDFVWLGWSTQRWIAQQFAGSPSKPGQEVIVQYSPARGLTFQTAEQKRLFDRTFNWPPPLPPEVARDPDLAAANMPPEDMPLPTEPDAALSLALEFLRMARREDPEDADSLPVVHRRKVTNAAGVVSQLSGLDECQCGVPNRTHTVAFHDGARSAALIVDHTELLVRAASPQPSDVVTHCLELLHDCASDPGLITAWNPICLIARTLSDVHPYVRSAPGLKTIHVPLPDHAARLDTIRRLLIRESTVRLVDLDENELAAVTAGLGRRDLEDIVMRASDDRLTRDIALGRQRELMDAKSDRVVIRLDTNLDFDDLGGMMEAKREIDARMVAPIKAGHPEKAIRGMALIGPPGTGKSALAVAAGKRAGINAVEIRAGGLKSKWHGESEQKVEQLIEVVTMFAPCFVYMDEYDKLFGSSENASSENAPDQAMRGRIQQWMAEAQGIFFMVATNYPDRVDPALFRTGRIDTKAPILAPETPEERADILARLLNRYNVEGREDLLPAELVKLCTEHTQGWVGSDLEFAVKDAIGTLDLDPGLRLIDALRDSIADIIPADNPQIVRQQRQAILACNKLRLLPPKHRERRIAELRQQTIREEAEAPVASTPVAEEPTTRRRRSGF